MTDMKDDVVLADAAVASRPGFAPRPNAAAEARTLGVPVLDVVIPVYNEQAVLSESVHRLHRYLRDSFPYRVRITIADNASIDDTPRIAAELAAELDDVRAVRLEEKGRGRALHDVWSRSDAMVLAYMDVDLSTDLAAVAPLVAPLISGHSDLAIGTRLGRGSRVVRGAKREIISRCYNLILRSTLQARFSDAQCGFKAIRADVAHSLLPHVADTGWFFDTELLVLAERSGMRIHEVPVDWTDDPDSRVDIVQTAKDDLRGIWRLLNDLSRNRLPVEAIAEELGRGPIAPANPARFRTQVIRFGFVGVLSTLAYALLYLVFRPFVGDQAANFVSLLITAIGNTWANRWFTFGVTGRLGAVRHQMQGLIVFGIAWAITAGSLIGLRAAVPHASAVEEIITLTGANLLATVVRFVLLRGWVFRARRVAPDDELPATVQVVRPAASVPTAPDAPQSDAHAAASSAPAHTTAAPDARPQTMETTR